MNKDLKGPIDQADQFADLLAGYKKATSLLVSEKFAATHGDDLATVFAKADGEKRRELIEDLTLMVKSLAIDLELIELTGGKTGVEYLLDILKRPNDFTSEEVAIAEATIESLIQNNEARLKTEIAKSGETDYARSLAEMIQILRGQK